MLRSLQIVAVPVILVLALLAVAAGTGSPTPLHAAPPNAAPHAAQPLQGMVLAWEQGHLVRVPGAHIGTGSFSVQTDTSGRFTIPAAQRSAQLSVVRAGYGVVRKSVSSDYAVVFLRPLDVRAIYIPYDQLRRQDVLDWVLGHARAGTITALVVDVKDEGGSVLPIVANDTARSMGAVVGTGTDVEGFLAELQGLGVYRIARVVTFLDGRLARAFRETSVRTHEGTLFRDSIGLSWTTPLSDLARRHNVEIGINAAAFFEEVQYDYVRLPTDPSAAVRGGTTSEQRSASIARFAEEAADGLHAAGAAIALDTFGQTAVINHDDGIGQVLEDLAPFLDYYSPMVYPSTWSTGWFGLVYPPADPFRVVLGSVSMAVERSTPFPQVVVRPWLQDFHDYQARKLFYGSAEVRTQIDASAQAGAQGFMLWDPSLNYHLDVLTDLAIARTAAP